MDPELQQKLEKIEMELHKINASLSLTKTSIGKSFILGTFGALGATFGFAIVVAVIGYLLHIFGALPYVGSWFASLGGYLHK